MAEVVLEGVTKRYGSEITGVEDLSLQIADREFLVLVGPSGCGKSTTLRLIAGLESLSAGQISIGGRLVNEVSPSRRDIAMVFQNYALYPHMTVYGNLAFGLRLRYGGGFGARLLRRIVNPRRAAELSELRRGIDQRVRQAAERLSIQHMLNRKPHELSGGERQRVALGRAIVRNPAAFLFDEPLSNLDAKLRQQMRGELKRLHFELKSTTVYVTHDQIEAMTLGQRVAVMDRGRLQQVDAPEVVYRHPANMFVAKFFGSTPINLIPGELRRETGSWVFANPGWSLTLPAAIAARLGNGPRQVTLGIRGEDLSVPASQIGESWQTPPAVITQVDLWGDAVVISFRWAGGPELVAKLAGTAANPQFRKIGSQVSFALNPADCLWFDSASELNLLRTKT